MAEITIKIELEIRNSVFKNTLVVREHALVNVHYCNNNKKHPFRKARKVPAFPITSLGRSERTPTHSHVVSGPQDPKLRVELKPCPRPLQP